MENALIQTAAIVLSAILAVGGWLYNAYKERELRKFELRSKFRIDALEHALDAVLSLNETSPTAETIVKKFTKARSKIGVFGTDDEFREFERLLRLIESNAGGKLQGNNLNAFPKLLVANFRKEIGLPPRDVELEPKE